MCGGTEKISARATETGEKDSHRDGRTRAHEQTSHGPSVVPYGAAARRAHEGVASGFISIRDAAYRASTRSEPADKRKNAEHGRSDGQWLAGERGGGSTGHPPALAARGSHGRFVRDALANRGREAGGYQARARRCLRVLAPNSSVTAPVVIRSRQPLPADLSRCKMLTAWPSPGLIVRAAVQIAEK